MTPELVVDLFRYSLFVVITCVSVIVIPGLILGLAISVFQAATQINEQTLSFIPRLLITMGALAFFGPWLLKQLISFTENIINNIANYVN